MSVLQSTSRIVKLSGFRPKSLLRNLRRLPGYFSAYRRLKAQAADSPEPFEFGALFPLLDEGTKPAGSAHGHYFHQDLYVAQKIFAARPERHIDVGSRVDGFVAHVATFRPVDAIDVRPLVSTTENIRFLCADLMAPLPPELIGATDSLSCLHAIEHFGLGRYGDPLDFNGHLKGIANLYRMLRPGEPSTSRHRSVRGSASSSTPTASLHSPTCSIGSPHAFNCDPFRTLATMAICTAMSTARVPRPAIPLDCSTVAGSLS